MKPQFLVRGAGLMAAAALVVACTGTPAASPTQDAPTPDAPPIRVGVVTDIGGLGDQGFNDLANKGLEDAIAELGIEGRVLESTTDADYVPNIEQLASEGFDLVVSVGFLMTEATAAVAAEYPDVRFAIVDSAFDPPLENATGLLFKEQEAAFLTGYLAGLVTSSGIDRTNDEKLVSTVGLVKIPPVDRYLAGFLGGALHADPDIEVQNAYSNTFTDPAACKEIALQQIEAGSDVFLTGTPCGAGAYDAALEEDVWVVVADVDMLDNGPQFLTSAIKRVDIAVFRTIQSVLDGTFEGGGVTTFGLAEDGVGMGRVHESVPAEFVTQVEELREQVISGEVVPPTEIEDVLP